jgi:hypothetical protein
MPLQITDVQTPNNQQPAINTNNNNQPPTCVYVNPELLESLSLSLLATTCHLPEPSKQQDARRKTKYEIENVRRTLNAL